MMTLAAKPNARSARTRDALIQAGLRLFAARPVDAVPIDDIVSLAAVAKGSFFNHFEDKQQFAGAIATEIRRDIEARVGVANAHIANPLERLTSGMLTAVDFALCERERTIVMLRGLTGTTARDHPLNKGLRKDIEAGGAAGLLCEEARTSGLLFWLGTCQMLMVNVIERQFTRVEAAERMREIMTMALIGLGVDAAPAHALAQACAARLLASPEGWDTGDLPSG